MSKGSSAQPPNGSAQHGSDDPVSGAIQELLNSIRSNSGNSGQERTESLSMERSASDYEAIILRRQVENQSVQMQRSGGYGQPLAGGLTSVSTDLQRMVQQVRAHFMALADMEIRRMVDEALFGRPVPRVFEQDDDQPKANVRFKVDEGEHYEALAAGKDTDDGDASEEGEASEDLYEGTVTLVVMAGGNMQRVVKFVDELCQKPQFRMLRMAGSPQQQGAEISLGLREPLAFKEILAKMANVQRIESGPSSKQGGERTVVVHLTSEAA